MRSAETIQRGQFDSMKQSRLERSGQYGSFQSLMKGVKLLSFHGRCTPEDAFTWPSFGRLKRPSLLGSKVLDHSMYTCISTSSPKDQGRGHSREHSSTPHCLGDWSCHFLCDLLCTCRSDDIRGDCAGALRPPPPLPWVFSLGLAALLFLFVAFLSSPTLCLIYEISASALPIEEWRFCLGRSARPVKDRGVEAKVMIKS